MGVEDNLIRVGEEGVEEGVEEVGWGWGGAQVLDLVPQKPKRK